MHPPERRIPVEGIREAARLAVEAGSLRSVARQVGMSPMGLRHFIDGRAPYASTLRKLNTWYVQHADGRRDLSEAAARAALSVLLDAIPEPSRDQAAAALLDTLEQVHREYGARPPAWLARLRDGE